MSALCWHRIYKTNSKPFIRLPSLSGQIWASIRKNSPGLEENRQASALELGGALEPWGAPLRDCEGTGDEDDGCVDEDVEMERLGTCPC